MTKHESIMVLVNQAVKIEQRNILGAAYLACIAGMWADTLQYPENPFFGISEQLEKEFAIGRKASVSSRTTKVT